MNLLASKLVVVRGIGQAPYPLNAFDRAILRAGVGNYNHVKLSSILPPGAEIVIAEQPHICKVPPGSFMFAVSSQHISPPGSRATACVALASNEDPQLCGMVFEISGEMDVEDAQEIASNMAKIGMADRKWSVKEIAVLSETGSSNSLFTCAYIGVYYVL